MVRRKKPKSQNEPQSGSLGTTIQPAALVAPRSASDPSERLNLPTEAAPVANPNLNANPAGANNAVGETPAAETHPPDIPAHIAAANGNAHLRRLWRTVIRTYAGIHKKQLPAHFDKMAPAALDAYAQTIGLDMSQPAAALAASLAPMIAEHQQQQQQPSPATGQDGPAGAAAINAVAAGTVQPPAAGQQRPGVEVQAFQAQTEQMIVEGASCDPPEPACAPVALGCQSAGSNPPVACVAVSGALGVRDSGVGAVAVACSPIEAGAPPAVFEVSSQLPPPPPPGNDDRIFLQSRVCSGAVGVGRPVHPGRRM